MESNLTLAVDPCIGRPTIGVLAILGLRATAPFRAVALYASTRGPFSEPVNLLIMSASNQHSLSLYHAVSPVRSTSTSGIRVSQIPPPLLSYRRRRPTPGLLGYGQPLQLVHDAPHSILTHRSTTPGRYPARGTIALRVHSACPVHAKSVKKPSQAL